MIDSDYVFIGSGAASSFAIAWLTKNTNATITVLEAGESTFNRFSKDDFFHQDSRNSISSSMMAIQTGGSLNLWSGRLGILDESDFDNNHMYSEDFFSSYQDYLFWVSEVLNDHFDFDIVELENQTSISTKLEPHVSKWRTPPLNFKNQLLEWSESGRIQLIEETEVLKIIEEPNLIQVNTTQNTLHVAKSSTIFLGAGTLGNWKIMKTSGYIEENYLSQFSYHPKATIGSVTLNNVMDSSFLCDKKYGSDNTRLGFKLSEVFKKEISINSNSYVQIESALASGIISVMERFQLKYSLENVGLKRFMENLGMYVFSIVNRINLGRSRFNLKMYIDNNPSDEALTFQNGKFDFIPYKLQLKKDIALKKFKEALGNIGVNLAIKNSDSLDCNLHSHLIGGLTNLDNDKTPKNLVILGLGKFPRCGNINPTLSLAAYSYKKIKQLHDDSK